MPKAKSRSAQALPPTGQPQTPPSAPDVAAHLAALAPQGPTVPVDITNSSPTWSDFTLADGSTIRVRPILTNVRYEPNRYNDRGEPIYHFQITFAVTVAAPIHLMQGHQGHAQRKPGKVKKTARRIAK
jgi:hypothetical protein